MIKPLGNNDHDGKRSNRTLATVIIAAWRAEDVIARSINSALEQNVGSLEVIVADDASQDGTGDRVRAMMAEDSRIRYTRLERNGGPGAARNAALSMARGDWIAVLDSDDQMAAGRLARIIALAERVSADAVYDDLQPVDPAGVPLGPSHLDAQAITEPERWTLERFLAGCLALPGQSALGYLKPVLRRAFVEDIRLHYDETLRNGEDFHLVIALLAAGGAVWVTPDVGYLYTMRTGSISSRLDPEHAQALAAADAAFLERHAAAMPPEALRLMRRRQRRLGDLSASEAVFHALRAGRPGQGMVALIRRPRAAGRLFRQAGHAVMQRLTRLAKPRGQRPG